MNIRHRQWIALLLSIIMVFGHLGSAVGQVMSASMPGMAASHDADHGGMAMKSVSVASGGHRMSSRQMSSSMPACHSAQCVLCEHCAMACIGLVSAPLSSVQYPLFAFDAPTPRSSHPPLLVFSFLRPPDSSLA